MPAVPSTGRTPRSRHRRPIGKGAPAVGERLPCLIPDFQVLDPGSAFAAPPLGRRSCQAKNGPGRTAETPAAPGARHARCHHRHRRRLLREAREAREARPAACRTGIDPTVCHSRLDLCRRHSRRRTRPGRTASRVLSLSRERSLLNSRSPLSIPPSPPPSAVAPLVLSSVDIHAQRLPSPNSGLAVVVSALSRSRRRSSSSSSSSSSTEGSSPPWRAAASKRAMATTWART